MLGTLAKWLRILGYDTLFDPDLDDNQLVRLARAEDRVLLTRDRETLFDVQRREHHVMPETAVLVAHDQVLAGLVEGGSAGARWLPLESEFGFNSYGWAALAGITDGEQKWIRAPEPELYDLADDPGEERNLAAQRPEERDRLASLWRDRVTEDRRSSPVQDASESERSERLARLSALGYVTTPSGASHGDEKRREKEQNRARYEKRRRDPTDRDRGGRRQAFGVGSCPGIDGPPIAHGDSISRPSGVHRPCVRLR